MLGQGQLAGIGRDTMLHAGTHERSLRAKQRHGLTLHVRAHESAVGVVMLEEGNERGGDRVHLARGYVHVLHVLDGHFLGIAKDAIGVLGAADDALGSDKLAGLLVNGTEHARLGIEGLVCLGDGVVLLLVRGQIVDIVGDLSIDDAAIRRLDEAEVIDTGVGRQRADESDVRAFRRLDGAHAAVVRGVNVANLEAGALAGQTTRTECGQTTLVRDASCRVGLVEELRELRGAEELLDGGDDGTNVDERLR